MKLNCDKALFDLQWQPTLKFEETVKITVEWYKHYYQDHKQDNAGSIYNFTLQQIEEYTHIAQQRGMSWAG